MYKKACFVQLVTVQHYSAGKPECVTDAAACLRGDFGPLSRKRVRIES